MKTWLITGCSSGFGHDIAATALERGDNVVATARRPESLTGLDGALMLALDVTDPAQIDAAVAATLDRFGRIDVLVNNAGIGSVGAVEMIEPDHLRHVMETMFFGAVALTQAVVPHMRENDPPTRGAIVQISSMGGQVVFPGYGAYCAAKFALEAMSEALAAEVGPLGIKVVIVEPGAFRTGLLGGTMHRSPEIDDYAGTANATRAAAEAMDGTQAGDPRKAAAAIADAVDADRPPLHLALGEDALDAIRAAQDARRADLDAWADVSRATALSP